MNTLFSVGEGGEGCVRGLQRERGIELSLSVRQEGEGEREERGSARSGGGEVRTDLLETGGGWTGG